eukprot:508789_1
MENIFHIKCVVVGDNGVGKTCMLISSCTESFPGEYCPMVFDNFSHSTIVDGNLVQLGLWDTACGKDYDKLRPLKYPDTDVVLICFDVVNRESFTNSQLVWHKEITHYLPTTSYILIGNKMDLLDIEEFEMPFVEKETINLLIAGLMYINNIIPTDIINLCFKYYYNAPILEKEGNEMAKTIGAEMYIQNSALTQEGLKNVFDEAIRAVLKGKPQKKSKKKNCLVM